MTGHSSNGLYKNRSIVKIGLSFLAVFAVLVTTLVVARSSEEPELVYLSDEDIKASKSRENSNQHERITRLFWQDRDDDTLKWSDLHFGEEWEVQPSTIENFPKLDQEKQNLVQMDILDGTLLIGVRDNAKGEFQSGWVSVGTGVREEPHGDHSDWVYDSPPEIQISSLDKKQGNPAHLYIYGDAFFLANDKKNGFTRISPHSHNTSHPRGQFYAGGGNHITMAAIDNKVCYSTWIDGGGPNKGRVDVVNLQEDAEKSKAYTFYLSSGVIHGATENSDRIFFAPSDGISWVDADKQAEQTTESVEVHHISLGTDKEKKKPLRTGAFVNHRNWVLFTTGSADSSALGLINAEAPDPTVVKVPIDVSDGLSLVKPKVALSRSGNRYAFLFQDRKEGELEETLTIIDLDPNRDRDFSDASIVSTLPVGASKVQGHSGHHAICFDPDGKYAYLTNPGEGTIWVLSLSDFEVKSKLKVGGMPTAIRCIGGQHHH